MFSKFLITVAKAAILATATVGAADQESKGSIEHVKVHFVPHSHLDAGWLSTYDVYY